MNQARWVVSFLAAGALALALLLGSASAFAQQSAPPPPPKKKARKVWTEEDLQQLKGGRVNVVGTSLKKPEAAAAPEGQAVAAQQPAAATNFYSDLTMEEREPWIAKYEREIANVEAVLVEQRSRALTAPTEEERAAARADVEKLELAVEANRVEIELIRNTPPPKPAAKPKPAPGAAPSAPTPPSA